MVSNDITEVRSALIHGVTVIRGVPPNFIDICAVLPGARQPNAIFTYAPYVYVPGGQLDAMLAAHETVHLDQQGDDPVTWWQRYLDDVEFRYAQELPAHRAELRCFTDVVKDRELRARYRNVVAMRLSGPLYGSVRKLNRVLKDLML